MIDPPIDQWRDRLTPALSRSAGLFNSVRLLQEVESTQDEAKRRRTRPGEVIAAARQTSGRGRLGRTWADTESFGLAATFAVHAERIERLSIACAIAVASAAERFLPARVQIKWPNDILIRDRKLAGILIEAGDDATYIGIGFNVLQGAWQEGLAGRAISLREVGAKVSRVDVLATLIQTLPQALQMGDEGMLEFFQARDCVTGRSGVFTHDGRRYEGQVVRIEPWSGLTIRTAQGEVALPAATTSVIDLGPRILSGHDASRGPM